MKFKIQVFIGLTLLLLTLANPSANYTQSWTPGVTNGDYFTYKMYGIYTSSSSKNLELLIPEFEKNTTEWVRINITAIEGSTINQIYTLHYVGGNETSFSFKTDVNPQNQGTFRIADKGVPICAANLKEGDRIPTAEITLNQTATRTYKNGLRETNHASWNVSDDWGDIYFDRKTGMLVELKRTHIFANLASGETVEKTDVIRLIDTVCWKVF